MNNDLDHSPLFDDRLISLVQKSLVSSTFIPLNGYEKIILDNKKNIINLNAEMNSQLIKKLQEYKKYFAVDVALEFLIFSMKRNLLDNAIEILEAGVSVGMSADLRTLQKTLKQSLEVNGHLMMIINGDVSDDRHDPEKYVFSSWLNHEAMKDFK